MAHTTKQARRRKCNRQGACKTWVYTSPVSRKSLLKRLLGGKK